jgi:hypothetical protein
VLKKSSPRIVSLLVATLVIATAGVLAAQDDDPHLGTWRLNLEKSSFNPGPPLAAQARTYQTVRDRYSGDGIRATVETIDADGNRTFGGYLAFFDGRGYPLTNDPTVLTMTLIRVDRSTLVATLKRGTTIVMTTRNEVSPDGHVMKLIERGAGEDGPPVYNVLVYDRQ